MAGTGRSDERSQARGVSGQIVSNGVSWLELVTLEEWQPVPVLALPRLRGTCLFYPDGTVVIDVDASMDEWEVIPGLVEFRNVSVSVAVAPFQPMGNFSMPDMRVAASGGLLLGGEENGLYVEIGGTLDTATRSGSVWLSHAGGWSPLNKGYVGSTAMSGGGAFGPEYAFTHEQATGSSSRSAAVLITRLHLEVWYSAP